jgi:hypothetical protein
MIFFAYMGLTRQKLLDDVKKKNKKIKIEILLLNVLFI